MKSQNPFSVVIIILGKESDSCSFQTKLFIHKIAVTIWHYIMTKSKRVNQETKKADHGLSNAHNMLHISK